MKKAERVVAGKKSALRRESDRALVDQIRRLLALPMNKRTNFLRKRRRDGGSYVSLVHHGFGGATGQHDGSRARA